MSFYRKKPKTEEAVNKLVAYVVLNREITTRKTVEWGQLISHIAFSLVNSITDA